MKKIYSLVLLAFMTVGSVFATEPQDAFLLESENLDQEFKQLNEIEAYVNANEGVTLEQLENENSQLVEGISLSADASASLAADELPLGVPAFWWGCILTVVGVILVYVLTDNDKEQTKKALIGCLVTAGAYVIFYIVLYGLVLGNVAWLL